MQTAWKERAPSLDGRDPAELAAAARAAVEGVTFGSLGDERFHLDPVPRVIEAAEWEPLAAGLAQRVRSTRGARTSTAPGGSSPTASSPRA